MKPILTAILVCCIYLSNAQVLRWAQGYGSTSSDAVMGFCRDGKGNLYSTGWFTGTIDFDNGPGVFNMTGTRDLFVLKQDSSGNFIFAKQVGGIGNCDAQDLAIDSHGNIVIVGQFSGMQDFDPGVGVDTIKSWSNTNKNIFVLKLDSSGNYLWTKTFGNSSTETADEVEIDSHDRIVLSGSFGDSCDFDPGPGRSVEYGVSNSNQFALNLNSNGSLRWVASFGGTTSFTTYGGFDVTPDNGCVLSGAFMDSLVDLDPGPGTFHANHFHSVDVYHVKLDSLGNFVWGAVTSGLSTLTPYDLKVLPDGRVISVGTFSTNIDLDPGGGTFTKTSAGGNDVYVQLLSSAGTFVRGATFGGTANEIPWDVHYDSDLNVVIGGAFFGTTDFDPSPGNVNKTALGTKSDIYVLTLDSLLAYDWVAAMGGTNGTDVANRVIPSGANDVYVAGRFESTCDLDPSPATANFVGAGAADFFIAKISPNFPVNIEKIDTKHYTVYPNPTKRFVSIESESIIGQYTVHNSIGSVVMRGLANSNIAHLDFQGIQSGIFSIVTKTGVVRVIKSN